ncbi:ABC transporter permease [Deltaproteobacteria bacterium TL4]
MFILTLALKSLYNRRFTAILTVLAIALSVTLLFGVERIRKGAKNSFENTLTGTDLVVGARTGSVPLLLNSIFHIGNATNNISWETYQHFAQNPDVAWTIPIALGDSHQGYRVLGTTLDYFEHYQYGPSLQLEFTEGAEFHDVYDAVLGFEIALNLGYQLGQEIVLSHGIGEVSFLNHDDKPFRIVGILKKTGTPVDRTLHIPLEGIEAMHVDWKNGAPPLPGKEVQRDEIYGMDLKPDEITAFLVGLKSKYTLFQMQRNMNEYEKEPILAVLPGVALQQLWSLIGVAEIALRTISIFVVLIGLLGMLIMILTSLNERRREMAILRSVGAHPFHIFFLLVSEAGLLSMLGVLVGFVFLYLLLLFALPYAEHTYGLYIPMEMLSFYDIMVSAIIIGSGFIMGGVPAWRAYRNSLVDGMTIRL